MGRKTTLGQLLINATLPEDMRDYTRVLNKKGVENLLGDVAKRYPERYREISHKLSNVGRRAAFTTGGDSFGLEHLTPTAAGMRVKLLLRQDVKRILSDRALSPKARNEQILLAAGKYQKTLPDEVMAEALTVNNPLAIQVHGAGRGNPHNLNRLLGADLLYVDHRGDPIPVPVIRNYSEGMSPVEYFAAAFGARKGIIDLKNATQDAGYFSKQLKQATHRLMVSANDDDDNADESRGMPAATDDEDNEGALLSRAAGPYLRNTTLTPRILKDLQSRGIKDVLVRSPTVGGPEDGGVYARDVGVRERGRISPRGDYVGITAADALAEPIAQAQLSSKHTGGIASATAKAVGGFAAINNLVQVPDHYPGGATHAQADGRVSGIQPAPQGGHYVFVGSEKHYVPEGVPVTVERGAEVEAGDVLSGGIPNPAQIVKHKGIGEGRRYFVEAFRKTLQNSNAYGNRRNIELLARGLINHVRLTDEVGDWSPDDVVPYQVLERQWAARPGSAVADLGQAAGKYLEKPVLHYSLGTRVTPSVRKMLQQYQINQVEVHHEPPPFQPEMVRAMANISHDQDWAVPFLGSYQEKTLLKNVRRGAVSDTNSTSFVPSLMEGPDFGVTGHTKPWE
jgi:DNA-directed RNA polymerase subunit beta'